MRIAVSLKTRRNKAMSAGEFRAKVDELVAEYGLDPRLPEVSTLKDLAGHLVHMHHRYPTARLEMLNPKQDIEVHEGVAVLAERKYGHVLQVWTLARYHCPGIDKEISKIVVDGTGAHLFIGGPLNQREVFHAHAAAINPHRFADEGNRYALACELIRQFTGLEMDYHSYVGSVSVITVVRDMSSWHVEINRVPAPSS